MNIHFYKYQGAGNDFVIIDNREASIALNTSQIAFLCDRRFGIGADGLMLLQNTAEADFEMIYYNADGNESTMCGNGGRCIAAFAYHSNIVGKQTTFKAIDGIHDAVILPNNNVSLHMSDINTIQFENGYTIMNTGSPHYIKEVVDTDLVNVFEEGRNIRNQAIFQPKGINVNFVTPKEKGLKIRTYERGVEDETLACGTGVTAAAIASVKQQTGIFQVAVKAKGGDLSVMFEKRTADTAENIILTGGAKFVFEGNIEIED
ncbi:diaminopimelate epimerase [Taibaiella lutea]|uniref:Diaminopimelate epimerase n=1 Tax=Taibaiella lutea TaxID=2608001 RepID=A0A5M6CDD7_9BACT|nr:diaminopimelate epimerase [Taibaiella lutea]KAA5533184.1 diaminopimelate epimerase [Taibaiella lutea]